MTRVVALVLLIAPFVLCHDGWRVDHCARFRQNYEVYCRGIWTPEKLLRLAHHLEKIEKFCPNFKRVCLHTEEDRARAKKLRKKHRKKLEKHMKQEMTYEDIQERLSEMVPCTPECDARVHFHCTTECKCEYDWPTFQKFCFEPTLKEFEATCSDWFARCPQFEQLGKEEGPAPDRENRKPNSKTPAARNPPAPAPAPAPAPKPAPAPAPASGPAPLSGPAPAPNPSVQPVVETEEKKLDTAAAAAGEKFTKAETAATDAANELTKKTTEVDTLNNRKIELTGKKTAATITAEEETELAGIDVKITTAEEAKSTAEEADKNAKQALTEAKTKKDEAEQAVTDFKQKAEEKKRLEDAVKEADEKVKEAEPKAIAAATEATTKTEAHNDLEKKRKALEDEKTANGGMLEQAKEAELTQLATDVETAKTAMDTAVADKTTADQDLEEAKRKLTEAKAALEAFNKKP